MLRFNDCDWLRLNVRGNEWNSYLVQLHMDDTALLLLEKDCRLAGERICDLAELWQ